MDARQHLTQPLLHELSISQTKDGLTATTEQLLADVRMDLTGKKTLSVPIAQLSTLGVGVSSLIPALQTITSTTIVDTQGLYRLANAEVGDVLKTAKNGNFWGALKTVDGSSKFAQFQTADSVSLTSTLTMPINPATMMMAVALFSIEQQLGNISDMEREILSFLEIEKESEIEADIETLSEIMSQYKFNWDNTFFVSGNYNRILSIQRTARKNMLSYQKKVNDVLTSKQKIIARSKVNTLLNDLLKKFRYYRLSLYTFSLASMLGIMLSGNFKEENIVAVQDEIEAMSLTYREIFGKCSFFLERMSKSSVESNMLRGFGSASKAMGKFIGSIPVVSRGPVDEFLQASGSMLSENAANIDQGVVKSFASISNPETSIFVEKMKDMIQIYNHTSDILFDKQKIYLVSG